MNQVSSRNRSGRWFYDRNHIENLTPSRKAGIDAFDELRYRQTAASFIQVNFDRFLKMFLRFLLGMRKITSIDPAMYQHCHCIHAPILYDALLQGKMIVRLGFPF